jgi:hypothetical protein
MTLLEQIREAELVFIKEWLKARTIFAFMFYSTLCYMVLNQLPIPDVLKEIVSFLMGFYFGQKMPQQKKIEP